MSKSPEEIAKAWLKAFNDHDLEVLLALYDDNAEHFSPKLKIRKPETNGMVRGKNALHEWWKDAFERLPGLIYKERAITANSSKAFIEYTRIVPGEENMEVAELLVIRNGLIVESRVYHG